MPKYSFECHSCGARYTLFANQDDRIKVCKMCGADAHRLPPMVSGSNVTELIDSYSGVNLSPNFREEMSQRSLDHFWEVEVPRLCGEYPLSECLANGWMYYDESGKLQIHTKPPNKR